MNNKVKIIPILALSFFLFACQSGGNKDANKKQKETKEQPLVKAPTFNADSAYHYIEKQVSFGPRIPNTQAHKECADWLISKMKSFANKTTVQRATINSLGNAYKSVNIIGHFNPNAKERILLLAHWDTREFADAVKETANQHFDGADDGGSGVGALLEIARQLEKENPKIGVDILFTDVEDAGVDNKANSWGLGTQYWSRKAKQNGYNAKYGILLDMVGGKGARFFREMITRHYADAESKMVWDIANRIGYSSFFRYRQIGNIGITDDHEFVNRITGIPTMDIIGLQGNGDFMPWHHKITDNMDNISKKTLKAVGQTVLQVIYSNPDY